MEEKYIVRRKIAASVLGVALLLLMGVPYIGPIIAKFVAIVGGVCLCVWFVMWLLNWLGFI